MDMKQIEINRLRGVVREQAEELELVKKERKEVIRDFTGVLWRLLRELERGNTISEERQKVIKKYYDKYTSDINTACNGRECKVFRWIIYL